MRRNIRTPARNYHGAVIGWLQFTNSPATNVVGDSDLVQAGHGRWPPPALVGLPTPAYTNQLTVVGSRFTPVPSGQGDQHHQRDGDDEIRRPGCAGGDQLHV